MTSPSFILPTALPIRPSYRPSTSSRRPPPKACIEVPAWKQIPIDVDFAKDDQLFRLENELDSVLDIQDFKRAAQIRDELIRLTSGAYVAILSANLKFYQAFAKGSIVDMAGCWLQDNRVTCKHPLVPLATGYIDTLNSFGYMFSLGAPSINARNIVITVRGSIAWVTCEEHSGLFEGDDAKNEPANLYTTTGPVVMMATNIYSKRNGQWYICHHTAQPIMKDKY